MAWSTARKNRERDICARIDPVALRLEHWATRHVAVKHVVATLAVCMFAVVCIVVGDFIFNL